MSEVGALIINLQLQSAKFREDMGKVKNDLDDLKDKSDGAGSAMRGNMTDSRMSVMLLGDEIGVHLPRALSMYISKLPGVATAMQAAFPIIGIVAVIGIIGELIAKHEALAKALREAGDEATNSAVKQADETKGLELTNLKLDDQIARLEHKPSHNYLKEAMIETSEEVDKLAAAFASDFNKMGEKIQDQLGLWSQVKQYATDILHMGVGAGAAIAGLRKDELDAIASAMTNVEQKRRALAQADPLNAGAQKAAQQGLMAALQQQLTALDNAGKLFSDDKQKALEFATAAAQAASEIKDLHLAIEGGHKRTKAAGLEQHQANLEPLQQEAALQRVIASGVEAHAQALIHLARTKAETAIAATKGGEDDSIDGHLAQQKAAIEAEREDQIGAANASLAAKKTVYEADLKAAGSNVAKKRELDAQWKNDQQATADAIVQINADADKQVVSATRDAANQRAAAERAAAQQGYDDTLKDAVSAAQRNEKMQEEAAKNLRALHQQTDAQTLNAQITAVQEEVATEVAAYNTRIAQLDKFSADYLKKVKEFQDHIKQVEQQGDDQVTKLKTDAAQKQAAEIISAENRMRDAIATDIAHSIVMNKSLAAAFRQTGEEMAEQAIKNMLTSSWADDKQRISDAKTAAGNSWKWASAWGGPIAGAAAAAASFAGVMAFDTGGVIPGEGAVPIIGHGGEEVITKQLKERVERSEMWGNNEGGGIHNYHYSPTVHAMDADGVDRVLSKHNSVFQRHVASTLRRMNK